MSHPAPGKGAKKCFRVQGCEQGDGHRDMTHAERSRGHEEAGGGPKRKSMVGAGHVQQLSFHHLYAAAGGSQSIELWLVIYFIYFILFFFSGRNVSFPIAL